MTMHWFYRAILLHCMLSVTSSQILSAIHHLLDNYGGVVGAETQCDSSTFTCNDGHCIPTSWLCDGSRDCNDGEDEDRCLHSCLPHEFECADGGCISITMMCDGQADCHDASDEEDCGDEEVECSSDEKPCRNQLECVALNNTCDGEQDCTDGSDEENCFYFTCGQGEFRCGNTTQCLPNSWKCDGTTDCEDGSDEICSEEILNCKGFLCDDRSLCLTMPSVCNGHPECGDGSDEANNCYAACKAEGCSHGCHPTDGGVVCTCPEGYSALASDNRTCIDNDECSEVAFGQEPACSQQCTNTQGSFRCSCVLPYILEPNGHTCRVQSPAPLLLFSTANEIRKYNLRRESDLYGIVQQDLINVEDLEVDSHNRRVLWIDSGRKKIFSSALTRKGYELDKPVSVDVGLVNPVGFTYNWQARLLYIVDQYEGTIVVCGVDGLACAVIVDGLQARLPEDVLVDPLAKTLYWTETAHPACIMRSDLDGRNRAVFLETHMVYPDHLLIDYPTSTLYWVDTQIEVIHRVSLNVPESTRAESVQVVISYDVNHPSSLAIIEDTIIWSEKKTGSIMAANKFTGKDRHRLVKLNNGLTGVIVLHPALQPDVGDDVCWSAECSKVCVESSNTRGYTCLCPPEMVLHSDGITCVWTKTTPFLLIGSVTEIFQVPSDIIGHVNFRSLSAFGMYNIHTMDTNPYTQEVIFSMLGEDGRPLVCKSGNIWNTKFNYTVIENRAEYLGDSLSLAYDWAADQVFWLNAKRSTVEIFKTDGSSHSRLWFPEETDMKSIAINVTMGLLFYSTWGDHPRILVCKMDGDDCMLLTENVEKPDHLLTFDGRLYWNDLERHHISSVFYNGTDRVVHVQSPEENIFEDGVLNPVAIFPETFAVFKRLYFSDNSTAAVHIYDLHEPLCLTEYSLPQMPINDMVMLVPQTTEPDLPCMKNNGGCSDICVSLPSKEYECRCPTEKLLGQDQHTCHDKQAPCPPDQVFCDTTAGCVSKVDLCEGRTSCHTPATFVNCDDLEQASECPADNRCDQECTRTPQGLVCSCYYGFSLASDLHTCEDVDECLFRNGFCDELCHNTVGSYRCGCVNGHTPFLKTCISQDTKRTYLVVLTSNGVYRVSQDDNKEHPIFFSPISLASADIANPSFEPSSTDDQSEGMFRDETELYLAQTADSSGGKNISHILRMKGSLQSWITLPGEIIQLRVEQVTGNVYLIVREDQHHRLMICNKAKQCFVALSSDKWRPVSLVFHPSARMMYWTDAASRTIDGAYQDGQDAQQVLADVDAVVNGFTIDHLHERFYWIGSDTIYTAKLDGSGRYGLGNFPEMGLLCIDIFEGILYMAMKSQRNGRGIGKMVTYSRRTDVTIQHQMTYSIKDIRVAHSPPSVENPCAAKSCRYICVVSRDGARCMCPADMEINNSDGSCVKRDSTAQENSTPTHEQTTVTQSTQRPSTTTSSITTTSVTTSTATTTYQPYMVELTPVNKIGSRVHNMVICQKFCRNGGFCQLVAGDPVCSCLAGFTGKRCEARRKQTVSHNTPKDISVVPNGKKDNVTSITAPPDQLSAGSVTCIVIVIVGTVVGLAVAGFFFYRKKRSNGGRFAGVEFRTDCDKTSLMASSGQTDEFCYCRWDLDGNRLDSSTSSSDSAIFSGSSSPIPIVRPYSHSSAS